MYEHIVCLTEETTEETTEALYLMEIEGAAENFPLTAHRLCAKLWVC